MNRHSKGAKRRRKTVQVWTHAQARAALPYITSILRSAREHALETQAHRLQLHRQARQPGRPDRAALIAHQEMGMRANEAEERFREAIEELHALDIYCLDPIRGEAVIPFVHNDQLAWFVYDLFDETHLNFWRYDSDSWETRRPLSDIPEGPPPVAQPAG